jgi:hypothetical protein
VLIAVRHRDIRQGVPVSSVERGEAALLDQRRVMRVLQRSKVSSRVQYWQRSRKMHWLSRLSTGVARVAGI